MCGIAGIFHACPAKPVDEAGLRRMGRALAHRGPDGAGIWLDGPIGLAHRRLAIIDLQGGQQPMRSAESGAVLTFNGEIYNFRELRAELTALGVRFDERSDTEVLLRAFDTWGEDCVTRLQGMFAFAVWDARRGRVFAARDRLGIKPLYYRWDESTLMFASELKALMALSAFPLEVDDASFEAYLRLQYVPGPTTILRGVRRLRPAHVLSVSVAGDFDEHAYWHLKPATPAPDKELSDVRRFRGRLTSAVASHLVADVPVGALLSGGLDSGLIVAEMVAQAPGRVNTFSVGFQHGPRYDERPAAAEVAHHFNTIHHERLVTDRDAVAALPEVVAGMDEPLADYAALPTYLVAQLAARTVKVVLTGEGADELFGGYRRYRRERLLGPLASARRRYQSTHLFDDHELASLLGRPIRPSHAPLLRLDTSLDPVNRCCAADLKGWLPDDLLVKVDSMTMQCSLEARVPYLDHTFAEFAMSVPGSRKVSVLRGTHKILMREAAAGLLPAGIARRPKHGFTPPIDSWLRAGLAPLARELLLNPSAHVRRRVAGKAIDRLVAGHAQGRSHGHRVWSLMVFELWSRHYGVA